MKQEDLIKDLQKELQDIKKRNQKVEGDKAWETSTFRKVTIAVITYIIAALVMNVIGVSDYLSNALIPTLGYLLSTLTIPSIKRWWIAEKFGK